MTALNEGRIRPESRPQREKTDREREREGGRESEGREMEGWRKREQG